MVRRERERERRREEVEDEPVDEMSRGCSIFCCVMV